MCFMCDRQLKAFLRDGVAGAERYGCCAQTAFKNIIYQTNRVFGNVNGTLLSIEGGTGCGDQLKDVERPYHKL